MRLNIALLPKNKSQAFVDLSTSFSISSDYTLGNDSHPHITLTQFTVPDDYDIDELWEAVKSHLPTTELSIKLDKFSIFESAEHVWVSLLIKPDPVCNNLREQLFYFLKERGITCSSTSLEKYDPHLTLARKAKLSLLDQVKTRNEVHEEDTFLLSLGKSDEIGQFVEVIKRSDNNDKSIKKKKPQIQ